MGRPPYGGHELLSTVVRQFFFCVLPVTPTSEIFARLNPNMAADIGGKLMDQLHNLNGLHGTPKNTAVISAHHQFGISAESGANSN